MTQDNCCTPIGQIKRYVDCKGCDRKPKQETLEEAAEYYAHNYFEMHDNNNYKALGKGFQAGAKWQSERMYSEEEVLDILDKLLTSMVKGKKTGLMEQWFEQFKKK